MLAGFDLDELDSRGAQLVVEGIAVSLLDDDFGLHAGEVGDLADESFVIAGENSGEARLHRCSGAGGDQRGVSVGEFEHLRDAVPGGDFEVGDGDEVASSHGHDSFEFRMRQ